MGAAERHRLRRGGLPGRPPGRLGGAEIAQMLQPGPAKRLTVIVNESSRWHGRSAYAALLDVFQHRGLAGATVSRAIAGYTGSGSVQSVDFLELSSALPIRIEVTDTPEAIERVLPD